MVKAGKGLAAGKRTDYRRLGKMEDRDIRNACAQLAAVRANWSGHLLRVPKVDSVVSVK